MTGGGEESAGVRAPRRGARWAVVVALLFVAAVGAVATYFAESPSSRARIVRWRWALHWGTEEAAADAARLLGEHEAKSAVDDLIRFIQKRPVKATDTALRALGRIGDPRAIPFLRRAAAGELVDAGVRGATPLKSIDRRSALIALALLGERDAERTLLGMMAESGGDLLERADVASSLGASSSAEVVAALERLAADSAEPPAVRLAALKGLALSNDPARVAAALDLLQGIDDPRLLDGALRYVAVVTPTAETGSFGVLVKSRAEPLRTASLLVSGEAAAWSQVEAGTPGLAPAIEDALYTLTSARGAARGALLARVDERFCRLAAHRQGTNTTLPEEARMRREAVINRTIREHC